MGMVVATSAPEMTAEQEMAHIRDITVAAEAEAKEGDTFFLITTRSGQPFPPFHLSSAPPPPPAPLASVSI
jgi:hypothetical protein